jgi:hypothetical protein
LQRLPYLLSPGRIDLDNLRFAVSERSASTFQYQATRIKLEVCSTPSAEPPLRRQVLEQFSKYIGLDVHKETIAVAIAEGNAREVRFFGEIVNTPEALDKLVKQLSKTDA